MPRKKANSPATQRAADLMADFIGCWDSRDLNLSERTGERFAQIVKEKLARVNRLSRRRFAGRAD